jgi:hypothetical protein
MSQVFVHEIVTRARDFMCPEEFLANFANGGLHEQIPSRDGRVCTGNQLIRRSKLNGCSAV